MELRNITEHLNCFNYDHSKKPRIEVINYAKGEKVEVLINTNEIVFLLKGRVKYTLYPHSEYNLKRGEMLFLTIEYRSVHLSVESDTSMAILRLYNPIKLCENYFVERLFDPKECGIDIYDRQDKPEALAINPRMRYFINGVIDCVEDGIKCKHFFDMKIKEFFILLRAYYFKSEIRKFLYPILSSDTAFSEYVKSNRNKFPTVIALAKSMHLTQRQFALRFKKVFGCAPYSWMKEGKTLSIHYEITSTRKPIKQIAYECGFGSISQFTRFCKKELGKPPVELRSNAFQA